MTSENFLAFYPQFGSIPQVVLDEYIDQANMRFDEFLESQEEARRLYVGHKLTLYAQTFTEGQSGDPTMSGMAALKGAGVAAQALSKSVGGVSVSKSEGSALASIVGYGEFKQTEFGLQLITLAKNCTAGVRYVP
ncbi:MAG: DUF4054 domain-containing protein [Lachnospiraceae bacterium]|nr:DUF4054 domain-containing protein [Lachnospiraceae bacterium]